MDSRSDILNFSPSGRAYWRSFPPLLGNLIQRTLCLRRAALCVYARHQPILVLPFVGADMGNGRLDFFFLFFSFLSPDDKVAPFTSGPTIPAALPGTSQQTFLSGGSTPAPP